MENKTIPDEFVIDYEKSEVECKSEQKFYTDNIVDDSKVSGTNTVESTKSIDNAAVDDIFKALEKVKTYFIDSQIDEEKLAEFMFRMLNFNSTEEEKKILNPQLVDKMVNDMTKIDTTSADISSLYCAIENMLGENTAKMLYDKVCTENVDDILKSLLGEDTKKMMCDKLESENLDELLNKLINEKQNLQTSVEHTSFNEFLEKILGKDTEELIKKKLETFVSSTFVDVPDLDNETKTGIDEVEKNE